MIQTVVSLRPWPILLALLLAAALTGCGDDEVGAGTVSVRLEHRVDADELSFDQVLYTNAAGNRYSVSKLEYILTGITLESADGSFFELAGQHYRNAAAKGTGRMVNRSVPAATYSALRFTFGVTGNTPGTLPNQAHFDNMAWPAAMGGGGYHYMKLEGMYEDEGDEGGFAVHTGPAGGADFTFDVSLPLVLTVAQDAWEIQVVMNLGEWFANPNLYNFVGLGGIMGNADLQGQLQANGATVFALGSVGHLDLDELDHDDHGEGDHEEEGDDHSEHAEG